MGQSILFSFEGSLSEAADQTQKLVAINLTWESSMVKEAIDFCIKVELIGMKLDKDVQHQALFTQDYLVLRINKGEIFYFKFSLDCLIKN